MKLVSQVQGQRRDCLNRDVHEENMMIFVKKNAQKVEGNDKCRQV